MFRNVFIATISIFLFLSANAFAADGQPWQIIRTSGQVWLTKPDVQPVALTTGGNELQAGDQITTGKNGRVLLVRGEERIEMAPGTSIALPKDLGPFPTSITQSAGTITLDVEKKNVQHFEVGTPHMAAVVKGTQFSVTVTRDGTQVGVSRGQVQVSDFKTGQIGEILPGQAARVSLSGTPGIKLSGGGTFLPITQGAPRLPPVGVQASKPNAPVSDSATKDAGKSALASAPATDKPAKANSEIKPPRDPLANKQTLPVRHINHARNGNARSHDAGPSDGPSLPMNVVGGAGGGSAAPASNSGANQGPVANNVGSSASGAGVSGSGGRGASNLVSSTTDSATSAVANAASAAAVSSGVTNASVSTSRDDDVSNSQSGKGNSDRSGSGSNSNSGRNSNGNGNGNGSGKDNVNSAALKGKKG